MMRTDLIIVLGLLCGVGAACGAGDAGDRPAPERFQQMLKLFPDADKNGDGVLSMSEALEYRQKLVGKPKAPANRPAPTHADLKYGPHERNVLDLWLAKSDKPTPLVVYIHGGGFVGGDKAGANPAAIRTCLESGVSFMAINYRFRQHAAIQEILRDAARAIQFVRLNASAYNIDPKRIASFGGSAGGGTSLWLAAHDDLAEATSADPVLRQSSRIAAAGCMNPQASYDVTEWEKLIGKVKSEWSFMEDEDLWFYGFKSREDFTTAEGRKVLADCSMISQITKDDPPIVMTNTNPDVEPTARGQFIHHPRHCTAVQERCKAVGVPCEVHLLGGAGKDRSNVTGMVVDFLLKQMGVEKVPKP